MRSDLPNIEKLTREAFSITQNQALTVDEIIKGGSGRRYFRIKQVDNNWSVVAMHFTLDRPENARFESLSVFLDSQNIQVPKILAKNPKSHLLWLSDLGSLDLWETRNETWNEFQAPRYRSALAQVFKIHNIPSKSGAPIPELEPPFDVALYQWEQDYFFREFATRFSDCSEEQIGEIRCSKEAGALVDQLAQLPRQLIHRDFQSQNIMMLDESAWLIDYQGMRLGLAEYDIASLLFDPYVNLTEYQRDEMILYYFSLKQKAKHDEPLESFRARIFQCACQRLMQALGAYGFLGIGKEKTSFLQHIPSALERLEEVAIGQKIFPSLAPILSLKK